MDIQKMPKLKKKQIREKILFRVEARIFLLIFFLVVFFVGQFFLRRGIISSDFATYPSAEEGATNGADQTGGLDLSASSSPLSQRDLYLGSFGYSFSNIDQSKTDLYFDKIATAIFFPPDYSWQDATTTEPTDNYFQSVEFNSFQGPYEDERCLKRNCLSQKGNKLYYNGRILAHPAGVRNLDIAAVSIGALSERWLVGYTVKTKDGYLGRVFYFNGWKFVEVALGKPLTSDYFGLLGFGGEENDFLIIYGAYQGVAYRVRDDKVTNLDKFFGFRVMDKGFKAEAIKVVSGNNVSWYIYSRTSDRPQLIKLWQNGGEEIVGEEVFSDLLSGYRSAAIKLQSDSKEEIALTVGLTDKKGNKSVKIFIDRGFKNTSIGTLTTVPITHDGGQSEIVIKKIAHGRVDVDAKSRSTVMFLFSLDGKNWQNVPIGENLDFLTPKLKFYFLKLLFPPNQDKFYSPFVSGISFDYYCQK